MDDGVETGSDQPERAQVLLAKIAELLNVPPAFFLAPAELAAEADWAEVLRAFQAIGDPDLRRSVLEMLRDLGSKGSRPSDPGTTDA